MMLNTTLREEAPGALRHVQITPTNDLDFSISERVDHVFSTLREAYAQVGYALYRTDRNDGDVTFWIERRGQVQHLPSLDCAKQCLEQIGGRP